MVILEIKSLIPKLFILKIFSFILISYFSDFVLYWYTLIRSTKPCIDLIKRLQLYNIWFFNQKFQTTYLEKQGCFFIALHHVTNRFPFLVLPKSGSNGLRKLLQKKANIWGRMPVAVTIYTSCPHPFSVSQYKREWEEEENLYLAARARKNWY